jgi:hypothetical protein
MIIYTDVVVESATEHKRAARRGRRHFFLVFLLHYRPNLLLLAAMEMRWGSYVHIITLETRGQPPGVLCPIRESFRARAYARDPPDVK